MTVYMDGKAYFLDYRETAPRAATRDMYLDTDGNVVENLSLIGARAAGVPGTVMGLWEAHRRFGRLKWADLVRPAIVYAEHGFTVAPQQYQYRADALRQFAGKTGFARYFGSLKAGATFRQPELAATLRRIARQGPEDFYRGTTARLLVRQMRRDNGLIDMDDLRGYTARWRDPVSFEWRGHRIHTAPPPSSGGIALAQLLLLKDYRAADFRQVAHNSARYLHLLAEIEKRVFADRADYLGDPDFSKVPTERLTDPVYLAGRAADINPASISPTGSIKAGLEPHQTTHFSLIDKWGNAVANTYTLNLDFGSGVVVRGAGFLLNNEMDDFSAKPGTANAFGVVGRDANAIAPGKRMLSSMSPTILTRDGRVVLVIGTPGGSRIFTSIFQVLNNLYDFAMPLQDAVAAQRVHHQLLPKDTLFYDDYAPLDGPVADELKAMGYVLKDQGWRMGDIQAIRVSDDGTPVTASDPRGRGEGMVVP
ncbi:gamma-glutamyltransferase [Paludibacterium paludis]|uniref:Glutathione hydrolase proenzyme n=2 Tax=Paludibacterium paludis TaxID=1225769 RepID=A0A918P0T3_9NEIS|nr:gamma-glutamyltransferase [Paludibacterium paludis]GGY11926.1 gamma-glutamyltranspeptidase [Paludibacterium paludis]